MKTLAISNHKKPLQQIRGLLVLTLLLLIAGCGGGRDSTSVHDPNVTAGRIVDIKARTGPVVAVRVGQTATLSDNNSFTTSSEPLRFYWSLLSRPDTSNAVLYNATSQNPGFVADVRGDYRAQLVVSAGNVISQRAVQLVVATVAPEPLTGTHFHQGLSSSCVNCHSDDFTAIGSKAGDHIASGNMCETCHTPLGFDIVPFVDHQQVFGNCSGCHNGVLAVGKSEFHLPTNGECDSCHNTVSFFALETDGSFDHTGISSGCASCHNGSAAIGKTPTPPHPDTGVECVACHTVAGFTAAFPDHTGPAVIGPGITCDSCHGISAIGQPNGHPVTVVDCTVCHSITSFNMGGIFNHRVVDATVQSCESCHNETNSINAPAKSSAVPAHPITSGDCANCHNTDSFSPAFGIDHTDPAVLAVRCDSCHNGVNATGLPTSTVLYAHMPITTEDCKDCHTPGTFTTGTYNHAGINSGCTACHDNRISIGKLLNHIPTNPATQDCVDCHNTTDFTAATFTHAGIDTGNCVLCHDGNISTGQPANHLPAAQNCFDCHNYTDVSFNLASNFFHNGITSNCETCHSGNPDYVAVGAIGKKLNHIPAQNGCTQCHSSSATNAGGFSPSATFVSAVHNSITRGCEGCHSDFFLPLPSDPTANLVKDVNHLPTAQDCDVCHNINAFTPTTMLAHSGITNNCVSCHDGNFAALGARAKTPSPPHPVTNQDCAFCHNTTAFVDAFVDHSDPAVLAARCDSCHGVTATGKDAKVNPPHVVTTEDCRVCHTPGGSFAPAVFNHTGIVDNCASCHDGTIATGTSAKINPPHIPISGQDCSVCHIPTSFADANFDHQGISANCGSCHNGVTALGKDNDHVPTNGDCVDCHQTTGFLPASFDHVGIVDNCASCHDAGLATPKSGNHLATNQDCGVCHNTNGFIPATFDHTGIVNNCASCHDGSTATGKIDAVPAHIATSLDCSSCHTTATFAGGSWTHDATSVGSCDNCHDGSIATGKIDAVPTHLVTTVQCDVCHTTNGWTPADFSHDPNGNYPGRHRREPSCSTCHGSPISATIPYRWTQYAPFCAACHANDFERKGDHIGGENGTVAQNQNCAGSGCHRVGDSEF